MPLDECKHSSKASGATPVGALTHPHGGNFTHSRIEIRPQVPDPSPRFHLAPQTSSNPPVSALATPPGGDYDLHRKLRVALPLSLRQRTPILN